jgi:CelD/BcsL family acetyltransferase involved in cellulose biosynthesis
LCNPKATGYHLTAWRRVIGEAFAFSKEARICVVSQGEVPLAAAFLYGFSGMLKIPWAASDKRDSRLSPNMLLYSSILEYACQQGFQVFDFGRSTPDSGTYRFKEQWGRNRLTYIDIIGVRKVGNYRN